MIVSKVLGPVFSWRFAKFCTVGASGVVVNLGCLRLLTGLGLQTNIASALAIEISIVSNLVINALWTFSDRGGRPFLTQAVRFHLVSLVGGTMQFLTFVLFNMVWLHTLSSEAVIRAYHAGAGGWVERWLWHPVVAPPEVGNLIYVSQLAGIAVATLSNYLLNFHWTWGER